MEELVAAIVDDHVPVLQFLHTMFEDAPQITEKEPALHVKHVEIALAAIVDDQSPTLHLRQKITDDEPTTDDHVPGTQLMQTAEEVELITELQVPALQLTHGGEPDADQVPKVHPVATHAATEVAPLDVVQSPETQFVQIEAAELAHVPALQVAQYAADVAATNEDHDPALHAIHTLELEAPVVEDQSPGIQEGQAAAPAREL